MMMRWLYCDGKSAYIMDMNGYSEQRALCQCK